MNIEELLKSIISDVLLLLNKKVLIFVSGSLTNAESLLNTLSDFEFIDYHIVLSDSAKFIIKKELIEKFKGNIINTFNELDDTVKSSDFILIPILTRNTLSKVAIGIEDNLVTTGIARAIMLNKEIYAVRDSFDAKNPINISEGFSSNLSYNSMLSKYENTLEGFGVKFIDSSEFKGSLSQRVYSSINKEDVGRDQGPRQNQTITKFNSTILTIKDIGRVLEDGIITIKENTIITPLAKDYIYNKNIGIKYF
ncbi:MAG: flavoprotein [Clostridiaceae bacterium]|nr:flavoprotein [Clostridiaceae bacterium]